MSAVRALLATLSFEMDEWLDQAVWRDRDVEDDEQHGELH